MDDSYEHIPTVLLPGMVALTIERGVERVNGLSHEMRESATLCSRMYERLKFLLGALPGQRSTMDADAYKKLVMTFAEAIVLAINDLRKFTAKRALQRVPATRRVRESVERVHGKIDAVFLAAGLSNAPAMQAWRANEAADLAEQYQLMNELITSARALVEGLSLDEIEEALTEIVLEINQRQHSSASQEQLQRAINAVASTLVVNGELPAWYVSRDDVKIGEQIDFGEFGAVHRAKWETDRTDVCVKLLLSDGSSAQVGLLKEANVWQKLSHPNIVRMLGACHVGKPLFSISEFAANGNLAGFLETSDNSGMLWHLVLGAAQGLAYMHNRSIVHADIKCNNILVTSDHRAQLCDFGFAYSRALSIGKSVKAQTEAVRWKAPECILETGVAANPTFASDVYSLGMAIIEAKTGKVPWGTADDDSIVDEVASGEGHPREAGVYTDAEWALVQGMTAFDPADRTPLALVIAQLQAFADDEARVNNGDVLVTVAANAVCRMCGHQSVTGSKFCNQCTNPLHIGIPVPRTPVFPEPECQKCERRCVPGSKFCIECASQQSSFSDESEKRHEPKGDVCHNYKATNSATTTACSKWYVNWRMSAIEMHSVYLHHIKQVKSWHVHASTQFVVTDIKTIKAAIAWFQHNALRLTTNVSSCLTCGISRQANEQVCRKCGVAVEVEPLTLEQLHDEIEWLRAVLQHSQAAAAVLARHQEELDKQVPMADCDECNEPIFETDEFCSWCGTEIEDANEHYDVFLP